MNRVMSVGLFVLLAATAVPKAVARPDDVMPASASQDHDFALKDGAGKYLAVHFVSHTEQAECTALVKECMEKSPTLAGVNHVFVGEGDGAEVKKWAAGFKDESVWVVADADGALAKELKLTEKVVTQHLPATVVLDPQGAESFRVEGTTEHDHLSFSSFAKKLGEKWGANVGEYNLPKSQPLALEGYDPVTYFTLDKPEKGRPELMSNYRGVQYQFSTVATRRAFAQDPERYLPTYGGWCATAMGKKGEKVEIDPTNFKVKDGRLFLFYKSLLADAKKDWNKHEREWEPAADKAWKGISGEEPIKPGAKK